MQVIKEDFEVYREVQEGGQTDLYDMEAVEELTGLSKMQIVYIMNNYNQLMEEFLPEIQTEEPKEETK